MNIFSFKKDIVLPEILLFSKILWKVVQNRLILENLMIYIDNILESACILVSTADMHEDVGLVRGLISTSIK